MSKKRRTKAQKIRSQRKINTPFNNVEIRHVTTKDKPVKNYFQTSSLETDPLNKKSKYADNTDILFNLKLIKKELLKSLSIASFILCLEVVIYLLWYK